MNYEKIYNQIIERGKSRKLDGYKEKHHIIPKCMGGKNDVGNIVELTAKEHFICHKLLIEIYPNEHKLHYAVWFMAGLKNDTTRNYNIGSLEYQRLKENIVVSKETKKKMSESAKGKLVSNETRKKMSSFWIGTTRSEKSKLNSSIAAKKRWKEMTYEEKQYMKSMFVHNTPHSKKTKLKMRENNIGKTLSDNHKRKISISSKNRAPINEETRKKLKKSCIK